MKVKSIDSKTVKDEPAYDDIVTPTEQISVDLLGALTEAQDELKSVYTEMTESENPEQYENAVQTRLRSYKRASSNIFKAYQKCIITNDELSARWNDLTKSKRRKLWPAAPANAVIDLAENKSGHFAMGINLYKLMWICFIASFAGVVVEVLWCLLKKGYIESRSGLMYGPFNLVYGVGAVALTLCLYRFRNKGKWISFAGGLIIGSLMEYVCSWGQEMLFGSTSWDYSAKPFNIHGRVCLLYGVFWGVLAVVWVKTLYPAIAKIILKIPNKSGKALSWVLALFFAVNSVITFAAVARWSERIENQAPSNAVEELMDTRFPDERMESVFANMSFNKEAVSLNK